VPDPEAMPQLKTEDVILFWLVRFIVHPQAALDCWS